MPRGCHAHQKKGLGSLICLATKILKIGPKMMELWHWQSKYPDPRIKVTSSSLISSLGLVTSMRGSGYFDCQGHNSLNFGPIFKILVAKHISVPRPFIWCAEHPRGTWLYAPKRVLKLVHENQKSQKLKKINFPSEGQLTFGRNPNLHGQPDLLGQKKDTPQTLPRLSYKPVKFWPLLASN